jgi:hypothetical protein
MVMDGIITIGASFLFKGVITCNIEFFESKKSLVNVWPL